MKPSYALPLQNRVDLLLEAPKKPRDGFVKHGNASTS